MQALPALPESLSIIEMGTQEGSELEARSLGALYLNIGLQVTIYQINYFIIYHLSQTENILCASKI